MIMPTVTRWHPLRLNTIDPSVLGDINSAFFGIFVFAQLLVAGIIIICNAI